MVTLQHFFQDFNPSKFVVFSCVLVFSFLFSLRLDNTIEWNYWVIFMPVWIWKFLVISGAIVGSYVWFKHPQYRFEGDSFVQFKAMIMTTSLHLMLLVFDILACDNLQTNTHPWLFVFIPLMFMSIVAIGFCVWAIKNERSFGLELFCSVNILQFIFLALRLDNVIKWSWVVSAPGPTALLLALLLCIEPSMYLFVLCLTVLTNYQTTKFRLVQIERSCRRQFQIVFIPIWILMCISMIGVIYAIILAIILLRSPDIMREQRQGNLNRAVGYSLLFVPMLVFEILLANRLDGDNNFKFTAITVPLYISLLTLIALSFGAKGGNHWWFGIRRDFCTFLLRACPCLQEYGNISYSVQASETLQENSVTTEKVTPSKRFMPEDQPRVIIPVVSIEMPD